MEMVMIKMKRIIVLLIGISCLWIGCGSNNQDSKKVVKKDKYMNFEMYINNQTLEELGFENFSQFAFRLLFTNQSVYILNSKDKMVVKYSKDKKHKVYSASGQGPGEFQNPINLFFLDDDTIVVFDIMRDMFMYFDKDLNYVRALSVKQSFYKINKIKEGYIAFGDLKNDAMFALLDQDLNIKSLYGNRNRKTKYSNVFPRGLYQGYLIEDNIVADTSWVYLNKKCSVDIVDIKSKKILCNLSWDNPTMVSQKTINDEKVYDSNLITSSDKYYFVQNSYSKEITILFSDLIVFDKKGKLRKQYNDFKYYLLDTRYCKKKDDGKVYFLDEEGNILSGEVIQK